MLQAQHRLPRRPVLCDHPYVHADSGSWTLPGRRLFHAPPAGSTVRVPLTEELVDATRFDLCEELAAERVQCLRDRLAAGVSDLLVRVVAHDPAAVRVGTDADAWTCEALLETTFVHLDFEVLRDLPCGRYDPGSVGKVSAELIGAARLPDTAQVGAFISELPAPMRSGTEARVAPLDCARVPVTIDRYAEYELKSMGVPGISAGRVAAATIAYADAVQRVLLDRHGRAQECLAVNDFVDAMLRCDDSYVTVTTKVSNLQLPAFDWAAEPGFMTVREYEQAVAARHRR
jgi:hypothetical protein